MVNLRATSNGSAFWTYDPLFKINSLRIAPWCPKHVAVGTLYEVCDLFYCTLIVHFVG